MNKKEYNKKYRKEHRQKEKEYRKKYREEHKEQIKKSNRKYSQTLKRKQYIKKYRLENKQKILDSAKNYRKNNKAKIRLAQKNYRETHKKYIKEYNKYYTKRILIKLVNNFRHRIWTALKGLCKSSSTKKLIGCSIEFLKSHLEKKFIEGMNWSNYGKWHVDHIRPCASFNLSKPEQQKQCFNYKNLQPLWALENLSKSDKL
jgi:hypothetical protein